ncbi:CsbD family protein [Enterococcus timonensis]|uniref:CsbD family protein n=1 Tax=Enterococcus timonensis TaxID=1852364 RepID=UPI0008DA1248|nr:CsbD family protein [Enterococcus timonensis]
MVNEDKIKGKLNELKGKVTNDASEELKGKVQQKVGDAKEDADKKKDEAAKKANDYLDRNDNNL